MTLEDWKRVALELKQSYTPAPHIMLWGGEPLVCPYFDELVVFLKSHGFVLGMVTNGVLLDKHMDLCKSAFRTIYVSVDGPEEVHDSIRGKGVFKKVTENIKTLSESVVHVAAMAVLSPMLFDRIAEFSVIAAQFGADELYLQDYIRVSKTEAEEYKTWMKNSFGINASEIDSWINELPAEYDRDKKAALKLISESDTPIPVTYIPHAGDGTLCRSPYRHIHVSWNGSVMYCTDFYDFSAGNVKDEKITDIFNNAVSQRFREELYNNPTCSHCSWRSKESFYL